MLTRADAGTSPTAEATSPTRPQPVGRAAARRPLVGLGFIAPTMILVVGLFLIPLAYLIYMSFTDYPLLGSPTPNGLDNYRQLGSDEQFLGAIKFTLIYTLVTTVVLFAVAFALVAISSSHRRGTVFYRTAFFLPYVVGTAAASSMWWIDSNDQLGVFNHALMSLHLIHQPIGLLGSPGKAFGTALALVVWKFVGFQVMVLLVGLQSIPTELYEAARVDGASTLQRLRYITVPGLKPTLALLTVLSVTGSLLAFDQFFVLTHGGPDNSTVTVVLALYNRAFQSFRLGSAAAEAVVILIVLVLVNVIQLRLLRDREK
ncbi:MAG TPA: sugar ABC transporter permease [Micromonosporaceae bacterium]|nr:sugar ABC transporter permease [Micromonosporaceae bacterium]